MDRSRHAGPAEPHGGALASWRGRTLAKQRRRYGVLLVAPALLVLAAILAWPIVDTILLSLQQARLKGGVLTAAFAGIDNYLALLDDAGVGAALWRTLYFAAIEVAAVVGIALGVALLLDHPLGRSGVFRVLLIVPWAIAPVANAVLWKWILNSSYGVLNALLLWFGAVDVGVVWLGDSFRALNMLLLVDVWKSVPFVAILLLAGLQKIPASLYRAARLDGASAWQRFRFVTLPSLRTPLAIAVILQTLWSFRVFDLIWVLTRGGPADGTVMLNYLAYRTTFNFLNFGYGAAIANLIFLASFLLAALYIRMMRAPAGPARA